MRHTRAARGARALVIAGLLGVGGLLAQEEVRVRIGTGGAQRIRLGIDEFAHGAEGAGVGDEVRRLIYQVLRDDLAYSLWFDVVEPAPSPEAWTGATPPPDPGSEWAGRGLAALLTGEVAMRGDVYTLHPRLLAGDLKRVIWEQAIECRKDGLRWEIHGVADQVVEALTGARGIARTRLAFVTRRGGTKEIAVMDYDGQNVARLTATGGLNLSPAWSPRGDELALTSYQGGRPEIYILTLASRRLRPFLTFPGLNSAAAWSPDGGRLAVTLSKDGNPEIYVDDYWTGKLRRLTFHKGIDTSPTWSPSGQEIAFTSDRAGTPHIYIMGADGSNVRRLTFEGNYNESPDWSPLGDKIVFLSRTVEESNMDLYAIDATGGNLRRLTGVGDNLDPSWSPDGLHIVFASNRSGSYEIYRMHWDGSEIQRLTFDGGNTTPVWSPRL